MPLWSELLIGLLPVIFTGGLILEFIRRRWNKQDEAAKLDVANRQAKVLDDAQLRKELWQEIGNLRGRTDTMQGQVLEAMKEKFELAGRITALEEANEKCKREVAGLKERIGAAFSEIEIERGHRGT